MTDVVGILDTVLFFFQAEDGIRDLIVTGVQTCALPISRLARQHVRFVHDVDLVTALAGGGVHGTLTQVAGVVHAPVRGGIELDDVEVHRASPDPGAGIALPARLTRRPRTAALAIERPREDTRRRGLADATRTREQVPVRHAAPGHRPA